MTPLRRHLAAVSALTALALLLAFAWIARNDRLAAQPADARKPAAKKDEPATDLTVFKGLNTMTSVDFMDVPIQKALKYVDEQTGDRLHILQDDQALKEVPIDLSEKTVTIKMMRFTVRRILKTILESNGLGYCIEDGRLRITTEKKAADEMVVKFYPIIKFVNDPKLLDSANNRVQLMKGNVQSLALLIMNTIEPNYWFINGGPGQMDWDTRSVSLSIKASVEMHLMLAANGLSTTAWKDLAPAPDSRVTRVYDITGLLDAKNVERSSDELLKALNLVMGIAEPRRAPQPCQPGQGMGMRGMGMGGMGMGGMGMGCCGGGGAGLLGNGGGFIGGGLFPPQGAAGGGGGLPISTQPPAADAPKPANPPAANPLPAAPPKTDVQERDNVSPVAVILPHLERLVVRQTPQVHQDIERFLADLKAAAGRAPAPK